MVRNLRINVSYICGRYQVLKNIGDTLVLALFYTNEEII